MPKDYVPPEHAHDGFNCPNPECGAYARQVWYLHTGGFRNRDPNPSNFQTWFNNLTVAICDKCHKYSLWVGQQMVFPPTYKALPPSPDMPDKAKQDYEEAQAIFSKSPRGAAALLRLAIQDLMPELGESGKDLDKDIGNLVKKGLHERLQQALDGVRVIGNNAVHPGQIDVNDNPGIALSLFTMVNIIVDSMITKAKEVDELYKILPTTAIEHIEERDKEAT